MFFSTNLPRYNLTIKKKTYTETRRVWEKRSPRSSTSSTKGKRSPKSPNSITKRKRLSPKGFNRVGKRIAFQSHNSPPSKLLKRSPATPKTTPPASPDKRSFSAPSKLGRQENPLAKRLFYYSDEEDEEDEPVIEQMAAPPPSTPEGVNQPGSETNGSPCLRMWRVMLTTPKGENKSRPLELKEQKQPESLEKLKLKAQEVVDACGGMIRAAPMFGKAGEKLAELEELLAQMK